MLAVTWTLVGDDERTRVKKVESSVDLSHNGNNDKAYCCAICVHSFIPHQPYRCRRRWTKEGIYKHISLQFSG